MSDVWGRLPLVQRLGYIEQERLRFGDVDEFTRFWLAQRQAREDARVTA